MPARSCGIQPVHGAVQCARSPVTSANILRSRRTGSWCTCPMSKMSTTTRMLVGVTSAWRLETSLEEVEAAPAQGLETGLVEASLETRKGCCRRPGRCHRSAGRSAGELRNRSGSCSMPQAGSKSTGTLRTSSLGARHPCTIRMAVRKGRASAQVLETGLVEAGLVSSETGKGCRRRPGRCHMSAGRSAGELPNRTGLCSRAPAGSKSTGTLHISSLGARRPCTIRMAAG